MPNFNERVKAALKFKSVYENWGYKVSFYADVNLGINGMIKCTVYPTNSLYTEVAIAVAQFNHSCEPVMLYGA